MTKLKQKLAAITMIIMVSFGVTACDLLGGDKADPSSSAQFETLKKQAAESRE